jgi:hypothetical protein
MQLSAVVGVEVVYCPRRRVGLSMLFVLEETSTVNHSEREKLSASCHYLDRAGVVVFLDLHRAGHEMFLILDKTSLELVVVEAGTHLVLLPNFHARDKVELEATVEDTRNCQPEPTAPRTAGAVSASLQSCKPNSNPMALAAPELVPGYKCPREQSRIHPLVYEHGDSKSNFRHPKLLQPFGEV